MRSIALLCSGWLIYLAVGQVGHSVRGSIRGVVVSSGGAGATPVRRASIRVRREGDPDSWSTVSDAEGYFHFSELPAGRFLVMASKPGYVANAFGATATGRPGVPVVVSEGAQIGDLRVILPRGAVLSGLLRDRLGRPLPNIAVRIARANSGRLLSGGDEFETDMTGTYRAFGLPAGRYIVAAIPHAVGVGAIQQMTDSEVDAQLRTSSEPAGPAVPAPASAYSAVFYPGTPIAESAQVVAVGEGEERDGIDFVVDATLTRTIEGTLTGPSATISPVQIGVWSNPPSFPPVLGAAPLMSRPNNAGHFSVSGLPPGRYTLSFRTGDPFPRPGTESSGSYAVVDVDVSNQDATGVSVVLRPSSDLSGRLVGDNAQQLDLSRFSLLLKPRSVHVAALWNSAPFETARTARVNSNGQFILSAVTPGEYELILEPSTAGPWAVKTAELDGRTATDDLISVGSGGGSELAVVVSDKWAQVTGTLTDPNNHPVNAYEIVAFPIESDQRGSLRRIKVVRPSADGRFVISTLPDGDYYIAAVVDIDPNEISPDLLSELAGSAVAIHLEAGQIKVENLRVVR